MRLVKRLSVLAVFAAMIDMSACGSNTPSPADAGLKDDLSAAWATHGQPPLVVSAVEGGQKPAPAPNHTKAPKPMPKKSQLVARTPTPAEPSYGFMNWFLNTGRKLLPSAPESSFAHLGAGTNMIYVDPENDLVVVARWIDNKATDGLVQRVLAAVIR